MKRTIYDASIEIAVNEEIIENAINAIHSRDTTAMDQSAAELKTLLDEHRKTR